jgi:hypothetical protein
MAGPAQVKFPGDDKNRRVRMRGIKKASGSIQKRLQHNLERMLDEPDHVMPERAKDGIWPRRDPLVRTLKEMRVVIEKRNDKRWLTKRMSKRRGDLVAKALAGAMFAANEGEPETVAIFNHPVYGETSYVRRGIGRPAHQASLANQHDPRFRLLVWEEQAKAGLWFFTIDDGVYCSGKRASPPDGWVQDGLEGTDLGLNKNDDVWWSSGLDEDIVRTSKKNKSGWVRMVLADRTIVGISSTVLRTSDEDLIPSLALRMLPPKLSAMSTAEWVWSPTGWPEDKAIPQAAADQAAEVMTAWLNMEIEDSEVAKRAKAAAIGAWDSGVIIGQRWFGVEDDWTEAIEGGTLECIAVKIALDAIEGGFHIRKDGVRLKLSDNVMRIEEVSANALLASIWDDDGGHIISKMFDLDIDKATDLAESQRRRGQGFNAFLKKLDDELGTQRKLAKLPWRGVDLPRVLAFAHQLITSAHSDGLGTTMSSVRKRNNDSEAALGWAWLVAHGRHSSEAWRFEQGARDKGSDWASSLKLLWQASQLLIDALDESEENIATLRTGFIDAMATLRTITGTIEELPKL